MQSLYTGTFDTPFDDQIRRKYIIICPVIVKASQRIRSEKTSYHQAWRALDDQQKLERQIELQSYELLIPYLESFVFNNPNSRIDYAVDEELAIKYVFICHGQTNAKLHHVRPVVSIDATFLKNTKGTLYMATALSANNELFPLAFAITNDNENTEGWKLFLSNLKKNCPILATRHPQNYLRFFAYFTYISDRDKGIIAAMREIFPNNHHTNCMIHIARNILSNKWGIEASKCITKIGETYSKPTEDHWLNLLKKHSKPAYNYITAIEPSLWRCTSWVRHDRLPPRYVIYTSNASESANNMFLHARKATNWLDTIDRILDIIIRRNDELFTKYKNYNTRDEIVPKQASHLKKLYNIVPSFEVLKIDEDTGEFKVNRSVYKVGERSVSHCINIIKKECTCGKWQDRCYPCIDAMAYFRKYEHYTLANIMAKEVSQFYNCRSLYHLYRKNIKPVIISTLTPDGETLPPGETNKRRAGRPKKKRMRNRSIFEDPEDSPIICSFCDGHGHNIRGCQLKHQMMSAQSTSTSGTQLDDAERAAALDPGYDRNMM